MHIKAKGPYAIALLLSLGACRLIDATGVEGAVIGFLGGLIQ